MKNMTLLFAFLLSSQTFADSSFNEVKKVVFGPTPLTHNINIDDEIRAYDHGQLPHYEVSKSKFIVNGVNKLMERTKQTLVDTVDYYPRLEKLLHSNGACFSGEWTITEANPYSGYFKRGSKGLFIGRASTTLSETERGDPRGFGLAGKIFPTMDPELKVKTANFFLIDVLMGADRDRFLDTKMTNNPKLGFRVSLLNMAIKVIQAFTAADKNPIYRPVYPIAEMGLGANEVVKSPKYMMIEADKSTERNDEIDFRDELNIKKNHPHGIKFNILVNDNSKKQNSSEWKKIGSIDLKESTVSYGCDRRLHFHHPKMK